ncbi:MAG TPA: trypsin-like serine protease [Enhygromyxa sp.]|nr:trypsin-like serine protease [Enhygromyxa sp.]
MAPILAAALFVPRESLAGDPPGEVEVGVEQDPAVYGGTAAKPCGWPTAVFLSFNGWACSGTLVHPDIVITAAHCPNSTGGRPASVWFGEGQGGGARQVGSTCYSSPGWTGQVGGTDYGYCKLNSSVEDVPIIPPAWGCDTTVLSPGREVVIVGFGQSDNGGSGSKREVTTVIQAIGDQAVIGGGGKDACQGDSGGPVYIKLKSEFGGDDSWRAFGITSGGGQCGQGGIFALMHVAIPWIEQHSGIDITPCHDSEGNWEPTPKCGGIPLDPANGAGTWQNGCSGGPISGFSELCGEAFGSGEDPDAPTVTITSPADGQSFPLADGESQAAVTIDAIADDGDGFGVADVRLVINGQEFSGNRDSSAPYSWNLVFVQGGYIIEAIATDWVGNESTPDVIAIGVNEPAPPLPEGDGDGDPGEGEGEGEGEGTAGPDGESGDFGGEDLDFDEDGSDKGCACSSSDAGDRSGSMLALLGLLGLAGLRRNRFAVASLAPARSRLR